MASSGASRLKPDGLNVHEKNTATYWFLNQKSDVRSSYYLEDPATEFDTQGLELDWVGVCWDAPPVKSTAGGADHSAGVRIQKRTKARTELFSLSGSGGGQSRS